MKHIVIAVLTVVLFASTPCPTFAEDGTSSSTNRGPSVVRVEKVREIAASRAADKKERVMEHRENIASRTAQRRELMADKLADHKERLASRAAELKERLATFRDKQKAAIVERINNVLNMINEKRTAAMDERLDRMAGLLDKLEARVASASGTGKDTASASAAIASASAAIDKATDAVAAQKLKDYTITVSSESGVRTDAQEARNRLHSDLQAVNKLLIEAKQSIAHAVRAAATTLGGIGNGK